MLAKLTALLTSKVALAVIGGTLVVGSTVTVAAAATGHMPAGVTIPGISPTQQHDNGNHGDTGDQGNHAHTIAVEGILTSYSSSAHTITVTGKADDEGDTSTTSGSDGTNSGGTSTGGTSTGGTSTGGTSTGGTSTGGTSTGGTSTGGTSTGGTSTGGTSTGGTNTGDTTGGTSTGGTSTGGTSTGGTSTGGSNTGDTTSGTGLSVSATGSTSSSGTTTSQEKKCSISSPVTITVNGSTKYTGTVKSEAELAAAVGRQIQVQSTASSDCKTLTAWKVTVGGKGDQHGTALEGKVGTINTGGNSFTVQPDEHGSAVTVKVSPSATKFEGAAHGLGDLKSGMSVTVFGTQQGDGSINAVLVVTEGSGDHGNGGGGTSTGGDHGNGGGGTSTGGDGQGH